MSKTDPGKQERGVKLIECIENGDKGQATKLLEAGADLGVVKMGDCPIHYAARKGKVDMLELLLAFKDNVNRPNQSKNTPMHLATRGGHMDAIMFLKGKNGNLNAKNEDGDTPLHAAVVIQSMDFIEKLVVLGMKVNEPNKKGETPLHTTALHSRQEAMEALLIKKANPTLKDKQGKTPAEVAISTSFQTLLRTYTALIAAKDSGYITAQGISVEPKKTMELKLQRLDVLITSIETKGLLPFQIYCRKEKAENSAVKFQSELEGEEAISDIFHVRVTDSIDTVSIQLNVPLYAKVKPTEQAILKLMDKESVDFDDLFLQGERMYCHLKLDLKPGTDEIFVVYTKPKIEELFASRDASVVRSQIEESFQLEVPKDTFAKETKLNLKVYENTSVSLPSRKKPKLESRVDTGRKDSLKNLPGRPAGQRQPKTGSKPVAKTDMKPEEKQAAPKQGITKAPDLKPLLLSDLYEINVEGSQPTKEITVQCPAIKEFKVVPDSEVVIVTADENDMKDETSLQVVQSAPKVVKGKFIFNVSHFSTYVPVLRKAFDENRQDVFRQIISAKKRQQPATFFVMVLEKVDGDPRSNIVLIEVIESRKTDSRLEFWQKKGYKRQIDGESDNILTGPNQEFIIEVTGNVVVDGMESTRRLAFMPRRASSQPFRVALKDEEDIPNGEIKLVPVLNEESDRPEVDILPKNITLQFILPIPPKPIDVTQSATKFDPGKTELKGPILTYLKTQFYKYPWIDQKHENEIKKNIEAMLKEYGVDKPPPIIVKNSITFCKRVYDEWKERIFYALINNDEDVNTAAMTPEELCYYVLSEYLPPAIEDAHIDFVLMLRCHAHEQDAFIKSTHGIQRASKKTLPITNTTFWREFELFLNRTNDKDTKAMEQLRAIELERIDACRNS